MLYNTGMSFNYAHALTGFYALKNCKNIDQVGILAHKDAFFLGTMGPDPYYGDAYPPPFPGRARSDLADRLHALDLCALLTAMLSLSDGSPVRTAYTMGFLCHVLLDSHVHPYIEARFPGQLHTPAEIAMDIPLVRRANIPALLAPPATFYKLDAADEIDALHADVFDRLFSLSTRGVYARSLKKWLRLNTFLYDPDGRKYARLRAFPKLQRYCIAPRPEKETEDLLNLSHKPWAAPWSPAQVRTSSVPERMEIAMREIRCLIDRIASGEREAALSALEGRTADAAGYFYE